MIVAHGNSIRGIIKFMKNLSNEEIVKLNIPTGIPYLMELDEDMQILKDEYIGVSDEELQAMQTVVANQTK
jgi:2,3-bisphosphoglycerate-dependent phosphoglycerate mutase